MGKTSQYSNHRQKTINMESSCSSFETLTGGMGSPSCDLQHEWGRCSCIQELWLRYHQCRQRVRFYLLKVKNQRLTRCSNIKFCVRWDSSANITAAQRTAIEASLQKNVKKWTDKLTGFEGWPFDTVTSQVVGWAARDKTKLEGTVSGDFYTTRDGEGIPECDPRCGRFFQ